MIVIMNKNMIENPSDNPKSQVERE